MRPQKQFPATPERRPGATLLIVITLMALFTAVGLSFVYYAEAEATAAKLFRESTDLARPDVDPEMALAYFLGKLIYPERDDDQSGIYNAGRGHDLARGIYGYNYTLQNINGTPTLVLAPQRAYSGTGRLHAAYPTVANGGNPILAGVDDYGLPNYRYWPADGFLRDPERVYLQPVPGKPPQLAYRAGPAAAVGTYAGGFHAPYTYPDLNSLYLGAFSSDPTTGNPLVLTPSYHREYLFGRFDFPPPPPGTALNTPPAGTNPNWVNSIGKYLTLRPRPIDNVTQAQVAAFNATLPPASQIPWPFVYEGLNAQQQLSLQSLMATLQAQGSLFPYPRDRGGDIPNLPGSLGFLGQGGSDSQWMDFGAPVMHSADGRKYKMLFAPLVTDLDGRVNLNVHGNIKNSGDFIAGGNQGWGRWEVNLQYVFNTANGRTDVPQLFRGLPTGAVFGRYGSSTGPHITPADFPTAQ
jgi:hypothetical protein